jgi:hypothetical protein
MWMQSRWPPLPATSAALSLYGGVHPGAGTAVRRRDAIELLRAPGRKHFGFEITPDRHRIRGFELPHPQGRGAKPKDKIQ